MLTRHLAGAKSPFEPCDIALNSLSLRFCQQHWLAAKPGPLKCLGHSCRNGNSLATVVRLVAADLIR